jgi:hypothetical protein
VLQIDSRFDHIRASPAFGELKVRLSEEVNRARAEVDGMMIAMW